MESTPPIPKPKRLLAVASLLLLVFLGIIVVVLGSHSKRDRVAIFPDGTRIELLGAVRGTNILTTGPAWQRLARNILPGRFKNWLPPAYTLNGVGSTPDDYPLRGSMLRTYSINSNVLGIYVLFKPPPSSGGVTLAAVPQFHAEIVYDTGLKTRSSEEYPFLAPFARIIGNPKSIRVPEVFYKFEFILAPQQPREIELHLFDGNDRPVASFRLPVPAK